MEQPLTVTEMETAEGNSITGFELPASGCGDYRIARTIFVDKDNTTPLSVGVSPFGSLNNPYPRIQARVPRPCLAISFASSDQPVSIAIEHRQ